ncbi:hypothetical protein A3K48_01620 [candidate division WOR-1 bacterium RIFOXYA12_FULL_52_29]|uniref:Organic solvent tolerance-like N-terminal domain-containing protein n=1 Tax=candidate division WOR-1 bacterium RIFOXYC12_FULL_54_18 TaxID=1802584 RepID=A0A1F4T5C7_UNCSA|nr:MAG: hypothetical protein A3K44_01620 [candidate division WOR-1 bacterium RIFOXYA2_FULL_51_19]OGC17282.1 MAG: hypothetical protein A3K48_01620 [candidate division WOR-1 bacterium RIFOXYA12_FULL_52_29]OGC26142.1 MAG: hypothetical protein A3K32_01615 [candidate division WOR-1 bacterium RIFOXYB2_FULL_45_9]OGC27699.1 MAG: hypothetical protein A3K49_01620 [candidate division WOR-1 bacterium RIFOXYC12_FULL_54_18]OGC30010.1 MAG: hypothetical protein A2346_04715 [candidate division WOR-1 bacterium R
MKKSLSLLIGLSCLALPLFALPNDFVINADNISYAKEAQIVDASGSVEVAYKEVMITGDRLLYDVSAETVTMRGSVELYYRDIHLKSGELFYQATRETVEAKDNIYFQYEGISMEGESLAYELLTRTGRAKELSFNFREIDLTGGEVNFSPDTFNLRRATLTTCDYQNPHYHVSAGEIVFYPRSRWLVAYWGYFWLGSFPIVPMPTYIYDLSAQERGNKNLPPFPQIGANEEDGSYINETLAWHLSRYLSGTYSLGYAERKGLQLGFNANYLLTDENKGNIRLNDNGSDGRSGGITHTYSFGEYSTDNDRLSFGLFTEPSEYRFSLETILSHRERINYQRVSFLPNVRFYSRGLSIIGKVIKGDLDLSAGIVDEENNQRVGRNSVNLKLFGELPENYLGYVVPSLVYDCAYYAGRERWEKPTLNLELIKKVNSRLGFNAGFSHYLFVNGTSPFNYELYRFRAADRLMASVLYDLDRTAAKISASYFLDDWTPEDVDYTLFLKFHCYNLEVTYRSIRKEFLLGFSLTPGNQ